MSQGKFLLIPMWTRDRERGCVVVEGDTRTPGDRALQNLWATSRTGFENLALWERATTDGLTRLYNRSFGMQRLEEIRSLDVRQKRSTSVLLIDIDKFKQVNDLHGHAAGDLLARGRVGGSQMRAPLGHRALGRKSS